MNQGSVPTSRFSVRSLSEAYDTGALKFTRTLYTAGTGAGLALGLTGVLFEFALSGFAKNSGAPVLIAVGAVVFIAGLAGRVTTHKAAREVRVNDSGILLLDSKGREFLLKWSDPKAKIEVGDFRAVPRDQRIPVMADIEFVLRGAIPLDAAIPREAMARILEEARRQHCAVDGWKDSPSVPGPVQVVRIRPKV